MSLCFMFVISKMTLTEMWIVLFNLIDLYLQLVNIEPVIILTF